MEFPPIFRSFLWQLKFNSKFRIGGNSNFPIVPMAAIWYSRPILIKLSSKFKTNYKILFPSVGVYMLKNTKEIIFLNFFPDYSYESYKT